MASAKDRHDAHQQALGLLGKDLSRRAGSKCELCGRGEALRVMEVPCGDEEPSLDSAILACERCRALPGARSIERPGELRFLETAVWADSSPVKVLAVRLLRRLGDESWAQDCLEGLWLDDELSARIDS